MNRSLRIALLMVTIGGASATASLASSRDGDNQAILLYRVADLSALQKMEIAFVGNPKRTQIRPLLDKALNLYGFQINDDRYERVGSVLVSMRKQFGTSEMQILNCIASDAGLAARATLPEAAVYCAAKFK